MMSLQYITAGHKLALEASDDVLKDVCNNNGKKCGDIDAVTMVGGEAAMVEVEVVKVSERTFTFISTERVSLN